MKYIIQPKNHLCNYKSNITLFLSLALHTMSTGRDRLLKNLKKFADFQYKIFTARYGQQLIDIFEFPVKLVLSPFTLAIDIAGSAPRGFGLPELAVATLGTYDIALELGKKVICQRNCGTCSGWQALRCTMCRGSGRVHYQVKNYTLKSGEKATAECIADAIAANRAELVHLPSSINLNAPLPSKDCPTCDGTGVMGCHECKDKLQVRISADDIMEPPWKAYNVLRKMDYPYEANRTFCFEHHIVHSMKDPSIAAFWLFTLPQVAGGFDFDDDVKKKIWWQYKESMRYDQLRDVVAKRKPGWENLQEALISIDPARAREDPVIVKNIPYYKAKKALEAEVMKLDPPPRPQNWGVQRKIRKMFTLILDNYELTVEHWQELDLPLNASSWSKEDLKNPEKFYEMTVLLNAQREIADKILDSQWENRWRQQRLNEMLEEKVRPYMQNIDSGILSQPIILPSQDQNQKYLLITVKIFGLCI
ncbi:embryo defective 2737 [Prunus dulcis]|uniref:Embryo defective 2737 n=1 Tax=Prunus dulcis TaxID=3755 RepID=A0A4Y1RD21_PRUDU|nr:embryo defective 2737 [Prunus dulcis]